MTNKKSVVKKDISAKKSKQKEPGNSGRSGRIGQPDLLKIIILPVCLTADLDGVQVAILPPVGQFFKDTLWLTNFPQRLIMTIFLNLEKILSLPAIHCGGACH